MPEQNKGAVLITGASTGIGKASAHLLDRSGYRVFAGVRQPEAGETLRKEASSNLTPVIIDVTDPTQISAATEKVEKVLGPQPHLTALVNNAGICVAGPLECLPIEILRQHLEVNAIGHIAVTQAFLPFLRRSKGRIINVGSATGRFALPFLGAYSASKFTLVALTDALRVELRPWGIPVSVVEPGTVETPMWEKSTEESRNLMEVELPDYARDLYENAMRSIERVMDSGRRQAITPQDVAEVVLKAVEAKKPKSRYRVGAGARMAVIGSFLPDRFTDWIFSKVLANKLTTKVLGW
jgi:NAD(P)-dependent dehydrogenase (short-subunit alcohol dehydrogenase family)